MKTPKIIVTLIFFMLVSSAFAQVDNPRGILPIGDQVYVLYTTFSEATDSASGMDLAVFDDLDRNDIVPVLQAPYHVAVEVLRGLVRASRSHF